MTQFSRILKELATKDVDTEIIEEGNAEKEGMEITTSKGTFYLKIGEEDRKRVKKVVDQFIKVNPDVGFTAIKRLAALAVKSKNVSWGDIIKKYDDETKKAFKEYFSIV